MADRLLLLTSVQPGRQFSLAEIQSATNDFDDELVIGHGGFGKVYKGCISIEETSHVVAIKRLDSKSNQGAPEFRAEIEMLSKLRHCNLVSLIGYCDDNKEMILVYAYMPNGTLYHHLHKAETPLNWMQRLQIAIGAGRGLDYLHTGLGTKHVVIHRDVKSSNILLDEKWAAMISDFGLSKIGPTNQSTSYVDASVKGTFGYLDPEYFYTRRLTRKTDVYAFGVILFELLTGRLAVDESNAEENISLVRWAQKCVKERKFDQMVDSNIQGTVLSKCLRGFAKIAYRCLLSVLKERPTMAEVVITLQDLLELQRRHDNSAEAPGITVFTWKIHKFLASTTKQNSDRNGTSSSKSLEMNMNQCSSTNKDGSDQVGVPCQHEESVVTDLKRFRYLDLRRATKNFGNGRNMKGMCFVQVYKGWIDKRTYSPSKANTGLPISIKTVDRRIYLPNLAWSELDLEMLKEFRHPNLEKLIGYCLKGKKLLLVYEFMPKGNFEDHLYTGTLFTLPLVAKVKIAVGIARGIVFLHKSQDLLGGRVFGESRLHRDKILLDEDYTVKLANYDVTKLVHGGYPWGVAFYELGIRDDYPGFKRGEPQSNFLGFTMAFIEVITGKTISNGREFQKMDDLFMKYGKMSLVHIAQSCFDICNEVDSESNMLKILEQYIPQNKEFATELLRARYCDDWLYPENSPEWHKYMKELW